VEVSKFRVEYVYIPVLPIKMEDVPVVYIVPVGPVFPVDPPEIIGDPPVSGETIAEIKDPAKFVIFGVFNCANFIENDICYKKI